MSRTINAFTCVTLRGEERRLCSAMSDARKRWSILIEAIRNGRLKCRNNSSLGLVQYTKLEQHSPWYKVTLKWNHRPLTLKMCLPQEESRITLTELTGFNNTGNVRVWPAEEIMTQLVVNNYTLFHSKTVCELGAGMTGMASLFLSMVSHMKELVISDGNKQSVSNMHQILNANQDKVIPNNDVIVQQILWGNLNTYKDYHHYFDVVLAADCLFFDEARLPLLETIKYILKPGGSCVIVAPARKFTFELFRDMCIECREFDLIRVTSLFDGHQRFINSVVPILSLSNCDLSEKDYENAVVNRNSNLPMFLELHKRVNLENVE